MHIAESLISPSGKRSIAADKSRRYRPSSSGLVTTGPPSRSQSGLIRRRAGMTDNQEVSYTVDFCAGRKRRQEKETSSSDRQLPEGAGGGSIPRIARLMALA